MYQAPQLKICRKVARALDVDLHRLHFHWLFNPKATRHLFCSMGFLSESRFFSQSVSVCTEIVTFVLCSCPKRILNHTCHIILIKDYWPVQVEVLTHRSLTLLWRVTSTASLLLLWHFNGQTVELKIPGSWVRILLFTESDIMSLRKLFTTFMLTPTFCHLGTMGPGK